MVDPRTGTPDPHPVPSPGGARKLLLLLAAAMVVLGVALFVFFDGGGPPPRPEIPLQEEREGEGDVVYVAPGEPEPYLPRRDPAPGPATREPVDGALPPEVGPPVGEVRPREPVRPDWDLPEPIAEDPLEEERVIVPDIAVVPPRLVRLDPPRYPPMARQRGQEATVEFRVQVDTRGKVSNVEAITPPAGWGFDEAARQAAMRAVYEPARRGDRPIPMTTRLAIRFVLE